MAAPVSSKSKQMAKNKVPPSSVANTALPDAIEALKPQTRASKKRKAEQVEPAKRVIPETPSPERRLQDSPPPKKRAKKSNSKATAAPTDEKRLRRFRAKPPQSYVAIAERAFSQRLCVLERRRSGTADEPREEVEIAGSTGNVYTVTISKLPTCDCPYAAKGNQCKHVVYVMARTLKARDDLVYQLALTSAELREVLTNAPPLPTEAAVAEPGGEPGRKPLEDDCPICYDAFETHDDAVWCKDGCGNNIHKSCFDMWAAQKRATGVTCPMCRTRWKTDTRVSKDAGVMNEGYRNVAAELGLSGRRDYSTYHGFWVQRQMRLGLAGDMEDDY